MAVDQARFPLVSDEEILEINETAASTNTARVTKTWMAAWAEWCKARNINVHMESHCPPALDGLLNKFYVEITKKDGTDYEPDSLRVMQAAIDRYLRHKNYPASIITGREFTKSQETLAAKAKQLRRQGKGKRLNKAQAYSETADEAILWREGKRTPQWPCVEKRKLKNISPRRWASEGRKTITTFMSKISSFSRFSSPSLQKLVNLVTRLSTEVTGHARESSLDDYDEVTVSERRELSHIAIDICSFFNICSINKQGRCQKKKIDLGKVHE